MLITELLDKNYIELNLKGSTKQAVISELGDLLMNGGALTDQAKYENAVLAREEEASTGIGFGIAIPHGKSEGVAKPAIALGIKREGLDWESIDDEDATIIFMLAIPQHQAGNEHLKVLQQLSRKLVDDDFRAALAAAADKDEIYSLLSQIAV
ncbi:PTS fructose transporter subunit IIA [Paenibacillus wynnii]|uniref:PTS fructose transporter subunit IIA n=1 Tax=Paenibacillus wynnii TaxID=268407 RepID=A0A098MFM1_9BACL|nr:PTS fructose transporter subunit IIA [Paenibacillus wynnii]